MKGRFIPQKTVVRLALISESILSAVALLLIWLFNINLPFSLDLRAVTVGVLATIPMLACNLLVFGMLSREGSPWPIYNRFKRTVVIPLCGNLNAGSALLVALLSGSAEELLFRGALLVQLSDWLTPLGGVFISSALFSYIHFIGTLRLYWQLALFYFFFGLYFCAIVIGSGNLLAAITMHALYNFVVILYLRYVEVTALVRSLEGEREKR